MSTVCLSQAVDEPSGPIPLFTSSQIRGAVGRCAVLVILHDLPGDGIMYWPKQVALQLGTIRKLSEYHQRNVRVPKLLI